MKRRISIALLLLLTISLLAGCKETNRNSKTNDDNRSSTKDSADTIGLAKVEFAQSDADMFTDRDYETDYDENNSILIQLNGTSATATSDSVKISGTTITITENTTHIISGTLDDGMIIVDAEDTAKLQLVLNGVNINSETSAPLYILEADKVFITLADGMDNTLSNGGTFADIDKNSVDSVIFSKQDITLNGSGTLNILSPAGHGIVSKDDLVITGGTYHVSSASHGLDANDSIRITGNTSLTTDAGKDGIHTENNDDTSLGFVYISNGNVKIEAEGDGISAGAYIQMEDGTIDILAGGGSENGTKQSSDSWGGFRGDRPDRGPLVTGKDAESATTTDSDSSSMKGLKAKTGMLISNGTIHINSADDSIHADTFITINGGTFEIASGDDGIHAGESLSITDGNINITESYEGLEALSVAIQGGDIRLVASDDGINAAGGTDSSGAGGRDAMFGGKGGMSSSNGSITISGGNIYIKMGGDGMDANGSILITDGSILVSGANIGDTAILDFDTTGDINGGTFIGTGASGMTQNFSSSSKQGVIMVTPGNQSAGTEIKLTDSNGNVLVSHTAEQDFSCVIISHASIVKDSSYTLTVGSSNFDITMDSTVYGSGNSGGNPGGNPGGNKGGNPRDKGGDRNGNWDGDRGKKDGLENAKL